jgi:hypothetical protein
LFLKDSVNIRLNNVHNFVYICSNYMRTLLNFFVIVQWDFGNCGHYWPIVPAADDR